MTKTTPKPAPKNRPKAYWPSEWQFWRPLFVVTSIYCIAAFILTTAAYTINEDWIVLPVLSIVFSQTQTTSIFAALGPGSYWIRLAVTQGCSFLVALSILGGLFIGNENSPHNVVRIGMPGVFVIGSVTAQCVYFMLRLSLGWRLHIKQTQRGPAYSLQDLFALTMYLGVALAILNASPLAPMKSPEFVAIMVGFLLGTILYGLPTLSTTFHSHDAEQGCFAQPIIIASIGFVVVLPFIALGAPSEVIGPLGGFLCGCSIFTALPLSQMRNHGFVLTNGKDKPLM